MHIHMKYTSTYPFFQAEITETNLILTVFSQFHLFHEEKNQKRSIPDFICQRNKPAAKRISKCHQKNQTKRIPTPDTGNGKIIHIGNAVLKTAHDKYGNTEEQTSETEHRRKFFPAVSLNSHVHQQAAENGQNQQTGRRIIQFIRTDTRNSLINFEISPCAADRCANKITTGKISNPDNNQAKKILKKILLVIDQIPHSTGEQAEPVTNDHHQTDGKQKCPNDFTRTGKVNRPADPDEHPR